MAEQRLQKILASAGVDSRRNCEELILEGNVRVNRKVVDTLPAFADPDKDIITVGGKRIFSERKVYYLLNKPKGVICTNSDPQGRRKAIDIVGSKERIFCVGRLDADTTGLIILTNDSDLTNKLTHPSYGIAKTYVARVKGRIEPQAVAKLKKGIWLVERKISSARKTVSARKTSSASVKILKNGHKESLLEIMLRQGLNRQVRRMLLNVGLPVRALKRTNIGKLNIRGIGAGRFRPLKTVEVNYLKKVTSGR